MMAGRKDTATRKDMAGKKIRVEERYGGKKDTAWPARERYGGERYDTASERKTKIWREDVQRGSRQNNQYRRIDVDHEDFLSALNFGRRRTVCRRWTKLMPETMLL
jgi:hypothetical protein